MIPTVFMVLISAVLVFVFVLVPWALVYLPGKKEDRAWLKYVENRTTHGWVHWKVKEGENSSCRTLWGLDEAKEELHELAIRSTSTKFLYSYSLKDDHDLRYTFNKKKLAEISINPWWSMNKLYKAASKQIKEGKYSYDWDKDPEETEPTERTPLFGLEWGEEPDWVKHNNVRLPRNRLEDAPGAETSAARVARRLGESS